jgi:hypothetical protein
MAGPRKPSVPLTSIVFRAGGRGTQLIVEPLPEAKEELELAIVERFLNGLRAQGRDVGRPERGPDPPDAVVQIDGVRVGIEVVEVIDPENAQRRAIQEQYLRALLPLLQDLEAQLEGVAMTVVDGYQEPMWPSVASNQGQRLVQFLCQKIRAAVGELAVVKMPRGFHQEWAGFEDPRFRLGIMAMRGQRISGAPAVGLDLHFSESFPMGVEKLNGLLAEAVERKLPKRYPEGKLWLLAYSNDHSVVEEESTNRACAVLSGREHPFEAVWAFWLLAGHNGGESVRVNPR